MPSGWDLVNVLTLYISNIFLLTYSYVFHTSRILKNHPQGQIILSPNKISHPWSQLFNLFSKPFIYCFVLIPQTPSGRERKETISAHHRWLNITKKNCQDSLRQLLGKRQVLSALLSWEWGQEVPMRGKNRKKEMLLASKPLNKKASSKCACVQAA